jgi:hypothetical protein
MHRTVQMNAVHIQTYIQTHCFNNVTRCSTSWSTAVRILLYHRRFHSEFKGIQKLNYTKNTLRFRIRRSLNKYYVLKIVTVEKLSLSLFSNQIKSIWAHKTLKLTICEYPKIFMRSNFCLSKFTNTAMHTVLSNWDALQGMMQVDTL